MKASWMRLWPYLRPYSHWVLLACAAGVLRFAIPLAVPWGVKVLVDEVLTRPAFEGRYLELCKVLGMLAAAYVFWILASYVRLYFTGLAGNLMIFDLRRKLYSHIQKMSLDFFDSRKTGAIVSRLMNDMSAVQQLLSHGVTTAFMDSVSIVLVAGLMWSLNWKLALVSFFALPLYVLTSKIFMDEIRLSSRRVQEQVEKLSGNLHEKISGVPVIQSFLKERDEENIFLAYCRDHLLSVLQNVKLQALGLSLMGFLAALTPLLVVGYGAWLVLQRTLSVGELVAFYAYVGFLYMPLNRLMELNVVVGGALAAIDRIFEILDMEPKVQESPFAIHPPAARGRIRFEDVSFSYEGGDPVFSHLDLEIAPEECAALTGPSGSGKSTLVKLLLRFYDVQEGTLWLDDHDVRRLGLSFLRSQIAWVPQEPILFSGSMLENILYGRPGAANREAVEAAKAAHAHEFIMRLPKQYETPVGEKGLALSAGEKQRIAIARAFLKKAPILILDEPSSALDECSEHLINESLKHLRKGKTALIISHRLSMMEEAGRVLHFWKGKAVEIKKPDFSAEISKSVLFFKNSRKDLT